MISRLRGIILGKKPPQILIEVQGVGYDVQAPMSTIFQLPEIGKEVILHIEFVVREDAHKLFGFLTETERELFNKITKVSGVGPKLGLAILSSMTTAHFMRTIQSSDVGSLVCLPGVGKKTAERLVLELRDKFTADKEAPDLFQDALNPITHNVSDAKEALVALGYSIKEAQQAVAKISPAELQGLSSEAIIKIALSRLLKISV